MPRSHLSRKKNIKKKNPQIYKLLAIPLIILISLVLILVKNNSLSKNNDLESLSDIDSQSYTEIVAQPTSTFINKENPEELFDRLLLEGKPIFVFFHSNDCQKCLDMIDVVNLVYPEFKDRIALVDVNVYDPINQIFLKRANIQAIPTQFFFNSNGVPSQTIGLMTQTELKDALVTIIGEK